MKWTWGLGDEFRRERSIASFRDSTSIQINSDESLWKDDSNTFTFDGKDIQNNCGVCAKYSGNINDKAHAMYVLEPITSAQFPFEFRYTIFR